MKGFGVEAGMPDVIAMHRGPVYGLKLKAEGGRATSKQFEGRAQWRALVALEQRKILLGAFSHVKLVMTATLEIRTSGPRRSG
jgi:hypothetical protein